MDPQVKQKVFIVEDDEFLSKMYNTKFQMEGFETEIAVNGEEALQKLPNLNPTIILLDIMMPKLDGIEVLRRLKQDARFKDIPVLVLTNLSAGEKVEEATKLGAVGYLIKSSKTPNEVVQEVKEILKKLSSPASAPPPLPQIDDPVS